MTEANRVVLLSVSGTMTWMDSSPAPGGKEEEIRGNRRGGTGNGHGGEAEESDQTG